MTFFQPYQLNFYQIIYEMSDVKRVIIGSIHDTFQIPYMDLSIQLHTRYVSNILWSSLNEKYSAFNFAL